MKRIILFVLSLTIPIGFLIGAVAAIDPWQDDVTMEVEHIYGDVSRTEEKQLYQGIKCGEHMLWESVYTPVTDEIHTDYTFSQAKMEWEYDWDDNDVYFSVDSGSGVSSSGGIELSEDGVGILLRAVADKTAAGETRTETLKLEEYMDTYPMSYNTNINTDRYMILQTYNSYGDSYGSSYRQWANLFRFPLLPGAEMEISLTKNAGGQVCDYYYTMYECPEIGIAAHVVEDGMYFAPYFLDWEGNPVTTGEYVHGNGVYYISFKPMPGFGSGINAQTGEEWYEGTFDFNNLKLVYGMEKEDRIVAMETSGDGQKLRLLTVEDGSYCYSELELAGGTVTYREEIMPCTVASVSEERFFSFPEEGVMILWSGQALAAVRTGEEPGVAFTCTLPEDIYMDDPRDAILEDGALFLTGYDGWGAYLAVCDGDGLGYYGRYRSSLLDTPPSHNSYDVYMEEIQFVKE